MAAPSKPANRWAEKPWRDAVRKVSVERDANGVRKLDRLAQTLFAAAEAGDMAAVKEIGNRLDGAVAQNLTVATTGRAPSDWSDAEVADIIARVAAAVSVGDGAEGTSEPDQEQLH